MKTVLITGAEGNIGGGLRRNLANSYSLRYLTREPVPGLESTAADIADLDAILPAFRDVDAVIHLAASATVDAAWKDVLHNNIEGLVNVFEASRQAGVKQVLFSSSNHAVGGYEADGVPEIYRRGSGVMVGIDAPLRPDSFYGISKAFGEAVGRYYFGEARPQGLLPAHRFRIAGRRPPLRGDHGRPGPLLAAADDAGAAPAPLRRHLAQPRRPRPAGGRLPARRAHQFRHLLRRLGQPLPLLDA